MKAEPACHSPHPCILMAKDFDQVSEGDTLFPLLQLCPGESPSQPPSGVFNSAFAFRLPLRENAPPYLACYLFIGGCSQVCC